MSYIDSDLDVFLQEPFGQKVHYAGGTKIGILDMPDQILSGDMIYSTDYVLQVKTTDFADLEIGETIKTDVNGIQTAFEVKGQRLLDDGKFTEITLSKT
tara:strand:- start:3067 stop:3363 length:297 start_codon:yes stop_codon:yes gene_type:complete